MGEGRSIDPPRQPARALVGAVHAAFFVAASWAALSISSEFFVGPAEATALFLPLAILVVGTVLAASGAVGGRPVLIAADLGLVVQLAAHLATTRETFLEGNPAWFAGTIVLGLAAAATTFSIGSADGPVTRVPRDRLFLVLLVVADAASVMLLAADDVGRPGVDAVNLLEQLILPTLGFDLAVFSAWWWGVRWPIALGGIAGLIQIGASIATTAPDIGRVAVVTVPFLLAAVACWVGPRRDARPAGPPPPDLTVAGTQPGDLRGGPLAAWIALGAVLWPVLVLFGVFPMGSDLCLECGPSFPGASQAAAATALTCIVVPIAAGIAYLGQTVGGAGRSALWLIFASGVLVLFEILTGLMGASRFFYLTIAASPAVLVTVGSLAALRRPGWLVGGGWIPVLAAAALVAVWTWSVHGGSFASVRDVPFVLVGLAQAAAAGLAVAAESARSRASQPSNRDVPTDALPIDVRP